MTTQTEDQLRTQAAMNELKALNDYIVNRMINMAAELQVMAAKIKELETPHE